MKVYSSSLAGSSVFTTFAIMISKSGENGYSSKNSHKKKILSLNGKKEPCTIKRSKKLRHHIVSNFGSMKYA